MCESAYCSPLAKTVFSPCESYTVLLSNPLKKLFVCWLCLHYNQFLVQASFLKQIPCLDLLTSSSCIRTPRFIMCCMDMLLTTQRNTSSHNFFFLESLVIPSVHFQCWTRQENMLGMKKLIGVCWQKHWSHLMKVECFTLKPTYENTLCAHSSSLQSILGASKWVFWRKHSAWISLLAHVIEHISL